MEVTVQKRPIVQIRSVIHDHSPGEFRFRGDLYSQESIFPLVVSVSVCLSVYRNFLPQILSTGVRVYDRLDTADWYVMNVAAISSVLRIFEKLISVLLKQ